jgi:hypothetical protein
MLFVQLETGLPKTQVQLRKEHSNMSLPQSWTEDTFALLNVARVQKTEAPAVGQYQTAQKDGIENVGGVWKEKWSVVDMFTDYTDDEGVTHTKAEQESAYQADLDAKVAESVRTQRDKLLAECDWVTVKAVDQNAQDSFGIQVPQVWLDYRQALRDITNHANFPSLQDADWPVEPE